MLFLCDTNIAEFKLSVADLMSSTGPCSLRKGKCIGKHIASEVADLKYLIVVLGL